MFESTSHLPKISFMFLHLRDIMVSYIKWSFKCKVVKLAGGPAKPNKNC